MTSEEHHMQIISGFMKQFKGVMDHSEQPIYLYLDEAHTVVNRHFASMLGFKSPKEWSSRKEGAMLDFVDGKSQSTLVKAFRTAMEKMIASETPIVWKTKSGKKVKTKVILVPVSYDGHLMALHFISK